MCVSPCNHDGYSQMNYLAAHALSRARTLQCAEQEAMEAKAGAIRTHLRQIAQERDSALLSQQLQEKGTLARLLVGFW